MLKQWFNFSYPNESQDNVVHRSTETHQAVSGSSNEAAVQPEASLAAPPSFEQIYNNAAVRPPRIPYGILKIADMLASVHLTGMAPEAKRSALMMALEAAGVEVEDVLQDAVVRQRALNDYEEAYQKRLKDLETAKSEENVKIQAELDRMTAQYLSRIQANVDDVAREQDRFRAWQKRKQLEVDRITEAAAYCVPAGSPNHNANLSSVLERATMPRR
jgi:Skp family chaperone for outer membrane proteins